MWDRFFTFCFFNQIAHKIIYGFVMQEYQLVEPMHKVCTFIIIKKLLAFSVTLCAPRLRREGTN